MGYRGYTEQLCPRGHLHENHDGYAPPVEFCLECGQPFKWTHQVNLTNGSDPRYPDTMPAPKERTHQETGTETEPGGRQFLRIIDCWRPTPGNTVWKRCRDPLLSPLRAPGNGRGWHLELYRVDEDLRAQVRAFICDNYLDSPAYQLNRKAGSFLQGDSEARLDSDGVPEGWMQIEFWTDDLAAMEAVHEHLANLLSNIRRENWKKRYPEPA